MPHSSKKSAAPAQGVVIRPATPADCAAISGLIHDLAEYEKAPECCFATEEKVREQLFGPNPAAEALMAHLDGRLVGFALFFQTFSTWLCKPGMYLEDLFVLPDARRHGVGTALLRRLAKIAVERDYGRLEWSCLEWNELAKERYRRVGAVPMEEWRTWRMNEAEIRALAGDCEPSEAPAPPPPPPAVEPTDPGIVVIHTDGGCRPNPGVGAWAAVMRSGGHVRELVGGELETTNNRMELMAAISALEALKRPCVVELHTDSEYLKNGITKWIHGWRRNNWMTSQKTPVKNDDLWRRLDAAMSRHTVRWSWLKGHAGDPLNERCDALCAAEIDRLEAQKRRR